MRKLFFAALIIACAAPFAAAQTASGGDYHKYDFYGGFSHDRVDFGGDREGFNGVEAAVTRNFSRYFGVKGDYSFHHKNFSGDSIDLHTLTGGVEFKDNAPDTKIKPFAHALVGFQHARFSTSGLGTFDTDNGFAAIIGGGLDFRVSPRVDIRAVQLDYNPTHFGGGTQHNFRIGAGIVFR
jgi:hypothetical protein